MDASDRKYPGRSFLGLRCKSLGRVVLFFLAQKRAVSRPSRYVPEDSVPDPYHYPKTAAPRLPFGPTTSPIIESYPLELIENHAFAQQIRNLEIRLARYTSSDHYHHHHQETCAQRRGRHRGGEPAGCFQSQEPLFEVEEESSPRETDDRGHALAAATTPGNPTPSIGPVVREARSSPAPNDFADGAGAGARKEWGERLRKFEVNFRRNCIVVRERAARASESAVAAVEAAMAANRTPKEATALRAAATVEGRGQVQADSGSQATIDRDTINEYWGSDYCISV